MARIVDSSERIDARLEERRRERPVVPVLRRVHVDEAAALRSSAGGHLQRLGEQDRAGRVEEPVGVGRQVAHVFVAGDRPERAVAGGLAPVHGRLGPQRIPRRVRVAVGGVPGGIDEDERVDDVGLVVQAGVVPRRLGDGHRRAPRLVGGPACGSSTGQEQVVEGLEQVAGRRRHQTDHADASDPVGQRDRVLVADVPGGHRSGQQRGGDLRGQRQRCGEPLRGDPAHPVDLVLHDLRDHRVVGRRGDRLGQEHRDDARPLDPGDHLGHALQQPVALASAHQRGGVLDRADLAVHGARRHAELAGDVAQRRLRQAVAHDAGDRGVEHGVERGRRGQREALGQHRELQDLAGTVSHGCTTYASICAFRLPPHAVCMCCRYSAGMPSVTIRDVPASTRDELAARAARSGRSLQEYLRGELIHLAERPDTATVLERIRQRKAQTGTTLRSADILELRDLDRR